MKKIITLLALTFNLYVNAQWVTIPDPHFVNYLQSIIPAAMSGNQLDTSNTLVTTTKHINVSNRGISNLFGVQYFSSLDTLECSWNKLTTLPVLPNSLAYLYCAYDSLISLPALPISLIYLQCMNNSLTNLPALPNSLYYLDCAANSLTNLPVLPNSLSWLICNSNYLTALPILPNSLVNLVCGDNNITCFPNFPISIHGLGLDPNPYNCLPNYSSAMDSAQLATPLCDSGNVNGCAVAGINKISDINNQVNIYPNPTSTNFTLETNFTDKQTLQIFDVNGKLVLSQIITGTTIIDARNLAEGVYNLSVINTNGVINKRLVIVK